MTNQEIFDKVLNHLRQQGKQCKGAVDCLYRGPDGMKCAVGCLIDDEHFNPQANTFTMYHEMVLDMCRKSGINLVESKYLLIALQDAHDTYDPKEESVGFVEYIEEKFAVIAKVYRLEYK